MTSKSMEELNSEEYEDQIKNDLEVASVLSKLEDASNKDSCFRNIPRSAPILQANTPAKYNFSPFRPSTAMTNISRGNTRTETPASTVEAINIDLNLYQMSAQGELVHIKARASSGDMNVNVPDEQGITALMWAAANNQILTVDYLLERGADPHIITDNKESALLFASAQGHHEVLNILLQHAVDINQTSQDGNTCFHYACFNNYVRCVEILLEWGVDITIKNHKDETALEMAIKQGYKEVQCLIEEHLRALLG